MKLLITLSSCAIALTSLTQAATCEKGCGKCDVTSRAAALLGGGQVHSQKSVHYQVTGMKSEESAAQLKAALTAVEGASVEKVCHKSGCAVVKYDDKKTSKEVIQKVITGKGLTVAGERVEISVLGMTCMGCSREVSMALKKLDGCSNTEVSHKTGKAVVTFDAKKISRAQVEAAITASGFKLAK